MEKTTHFYKTWTCNLSKKKCRWLTNTKMFHFPTSPLYCSNIFLVVSCCLSCFAILFIRLEYPCYQCRASPFLYYSWPNVMVLPVMYACVCVCWWRGSRVLFPICFPRNSLLCCHRHKIFPVNMACLCILCVTPTFFTSLNLTESTGFCW